MKKNTKILIVAIVVVVAVVALVWYAFSPKGEQQILQIRDCSFEQDHIAVNGSTMLNIGIDNNDKDNPHTLKIVFNTTKMVFFDGAAKLSYEDGFQVFSDSYRAGNRGGTKPLVVQGTVPDEAITVTWRVTLLFYIDGSEYDNRTLTLRVDR